MPGPATARSSGPVCRCLSSGLYLYPVSKRQSLIDEASFRTNRKQSAGSRESKTRLNFPESAGRAQLPRLLLNDNLRNHHFPPLALEPVLVLTIRLRSVPTGDGQRRSGDLSRCHRNFKRPRQPSYRRTVHVQELPRAPVGPDLPAARPIPL